MHLPCNQGFVLIRTGRLAEISAFHDNLQKAVRRHPLVRVRESVLRESEMFHQEGIKQPVPFQESGIFDKPPQHRAGRLKPERIQCGIADLPQPDSPAERMLHYMAAHQQHVQ